MDSKIDKIRSLLRDKGLDAILITNQSNFSWLSDGGRGHVAISSESSVASFFITEDEIFLITNNIEAQRLQDEEIKGIDYKVKQYPWHNDGKRKAIFQELFKNRKVGSDSAMEDTINISDDIAELRYILTDDELKRFRELGKHCGEAIGEVCKNIKPGLSEFDIAGAMSAELYKRGVTPIVLLIAVDERVSQYRHPLPTEKQVKKYGMIVVCGRKYGLIASLTRLFHFGPVSDELRRKHDAVVEVDTVFIAESRPGAVIGDIFSKAQKMYEEKGFPGEWEFHHQGGPAGYAPRDYVATPGNMKKVLKPQALAWNPSIKGTKSEDTIITTDDKPEIITATPGWPIITVSYKGEKWERPDILIL